MRKAILYLLALFPLYQYGQPASSSTQPATYLLEHFMDGSVLLKTGAIQPASLNYDANDQSIVFRQNDQYMILTGLDNIDTVYIGDRKFIPAEDKFYEVITSTPIAFLISYTCKPHPIVANTDHNGTSRQDDNRISNNVSDVYLTRRYEGHFEMEFQKRYWLRRGHTFYKANNENQIAKIFPAKADSIKIFIASNKINLNNQEDVARLIRYCNGQP